MGRFGCATSVTSDHTHTICSQVYWAHQTHQAESGMFCLLFKQRSYSEPCNNLSSSMLGNPKTHQTLHSPSSFGLSATGNAPVVARHPQVPSSTNNGTPTPSKPITQSPHYRSSSSNRRSQQIQRVIPNMLQAPIDRSVIQDYFSAQSSVFRGCVSWTCFVEGFPFRFVSWNVSWCVSLT